MYRRVSLVLLSLAILLATGCQDEDGQTLNEQPDTGQSVSTSQPPAEAGGGGDSGELTAAVAAPTEVVATPTPDVPLAATVNGQPITLGEFEKELARYEQARAELGLGDDDETANYRDVVLTALIETELIAQAAAQNGLTLSSLAVDERLAELQEASGGEANFAAWLQANQWTQDEFREALASEMLIEMAVDMVTSDVPFAVEQVRARYLQVDDEQLAISLLAQIQSGADFGTLARQYSLDRVTGEGGGELGFFSRGTLLVPEIEEAAFALQPGEVSEIITVVRDDGGQTTYYIVQVLERDPERQLTTDVRSNFLQQRFESWLAELWAQADIVRIVDTNS